MTKTLQIYLAPKLLPTRKGDLLERIIRMAVKDQELLFIPIEAFEIFRFM